MLDTGIDLKHPDMRACKDQIKDQYNWIDGQEKQNITDLNGHGTHTAGLILDYASDAEIFVAKIADKYPADPRTVAAVREHERKPKYILSSRLILPAQAIDYAVTTWKVDIISMSFGFPDRDIDNYTMLEEAIQNAHRAHVLLFAAASNSGANLSRAYPARHEEVMCIHSTDANGNRSRFSPTAKDGNNFATIGEAVESAWPSSLRSSKSNGSCTAFKSGTSFATPIAASIAAFLLLYARLHLEEKWATMLKRGSGMKAVLRKIAVKGGGHQKRDGYDYIELSRYSDNLFGKQEDLIRNEIIDAIKQS